MWEEDAIGGASASKESMRCY
ncbi:hypothetical protein CEXT_18091, partial [Caerostris extrusa]